MPFAIRGIYLLLTVKLKSELAFIIIHNELLFNDGRT